METLTEILPALDFITEDAPPCDGVPDKCPYEAVTRFYLSACCPQKGNSMDFCVSHREHFLGLHARVLKAGKDWLCAWCKNEVKILRWGPVR